MVFVMSSKDESVNERGVVVQASLDALREAIKKALFDFHEELEESGEEVGDEVDIGATVLFKEDFEVGPILIAATRVSDKMWHLISTSEILADALPTTRGSTRIAESERKKLRIIVKHLEHTEGEDAVYEPCEWDSCLSHEGKALSTVARATKRWGR